VFVPSDQVLILSMFAKISEIDFQPVLSSLGCTAACNTWKNDDTGNAGDYKLLLVF